MIHLQTYKMFESQQDGLTPEQREMLDSYCKPYRYDGGEVDPRKLWWVGEDGLVNVEGDFEINPTNHKYKGWKGLLGVKFGLVKGNFKVPGIDLESASDLPRSIGGKLSAEDNKLRTLEGIGLVGGSISVDRNLLVSLEGIPKDQWQYSNPNSLFSGISGNPVRGGFLTDDLMNVLKGEDTWTSIYLDIVAGEYSLFSVGYSAIQKDSDESIEWILKNKLSPEVLGEEIKKNPEKMAIKLAKIPSNHRKMLDGILDQIKDLPGGFKEDRDLLLTLGDVGL